MESSNAWRSPHGTPLPVVGGRTLIMGIVNVTPDSFSDGGAYVDVDEAVAQAGRLVRGGADIVDIGGESTRPGHQVVDVAEETRRVVEVTRALRRCMPGLPISVDTMKAPVADAAIVAGADMINDVWGLKHGLSDGALDAWTAAVRDGRGTEGLELPAMARVAALRDCPVFLMHNRRDMDYGTDFWATLLLDLRASIAMALAAGCRRCQLWVDPGFGFAKDFAMNLEVVRNLQRLHELGLPILLGTSRKSTIGRLLDRPVDQREAGTAATHVWGISRGCAMVRVHSVEAQLDAIRMADALRGG